VSLFAIARRRHGRAGRLWWRDARHGRPALAPLSARRRPAPPSPL